MFQVIHSLAPVYLFCFILVYLLLLANWTFYSRFHVSGPSLTCIVSSEISFSTFLHVWSVPYWPSPPPELVMTLNKLFKPHVCIGLFPKTATAVPSILHVLCNVTLPQLPCQFPFQNLSRLCDIHWPLECGELDAATCRDCVCTLESQLLCREVPAIQLEIEVT